MLKRVATLVLLAVSGASLARQNSQPPADLVIVNAKILTVDERFSEAAALAVRDGRFVMVGSVDDVRTRIGRGTRVIEGRGRTVIPGLIDSHVHALGVAAAEAVQPFQNLRSIGALQDWIRTEVGRVPQGT